MRLPRALVVSALSLAINGAHSADLLSLYREAANQDPAVASATASLQAARERVAQAEAANGFSAGINAAANANYFDLHVRTLPNAQTDRAYLTASVQAYVTKPLIRPANNVAIEQANAATGTGADDAHVGLKHGIFPELGSINV